MAAQLQLRRGTAAENDAFTGASGELTIDTTTPSIRIHDGSTAGGLPYVYNPTSKLGLFFAGRLYPSEVLAVYNVTDDYSVPAGLTGSIAYARSTGSFDASVYIYKNGVQIGSIDFAAGVNAGTFTFASPQTFTSGDRLEFINQGSSDSSLADVSVTLELTKV